MYKINEISKIANVSTRTLRYYDKIGLLSPSKIGENNYRYYSDDEINILQQIMFYKKLEFSLEEIKNIITDNNFNFMNALLEHKDALVSKKAQLDKLIETVEKTIQNEKGEYKMKNEEKFQGFKEELILENEKKYGDELKEKYGEDTMDASYQKMRKMSKWEFEEANRISEEIKVKLKEALITNDPNSEEANKLCSFHQKWIQMYWPTYSKEAHLGLVKMYTEDERFKAYYEKVAIGATDFLYKAMQIYLGK